MRSTPADRSMTERAWERAGIRSRSRAWWTVALVLGIVLTLGACRAPWGAKSPPWLAAKHARAWAAIDRDLSGLGPNVGLLVAQVAPGGVCLPIHHVAPFTPRPTASQFKLFVLGALAQQIANGRISWSQTMTIDVAVRSLGNGPGSFQTLPSGTAVTVEDAATKMISISDNTAADMLIGLVGRDAVEAQMRQWTTHASANVPFLTTREMFLLHYAKGLADQYLALPREQREAFLASSVDPLPIAAIATGLSADPRFIDTVEWFASPLDVCRAFAGLQRLARNPALGPLSTVLSLQTFGIALDRSTWPTLYYKGGSEPGVLTLGWLATDRHGRTFVVEAMVSNPDAVLATDSIPRLVAVAEAAFDVLDDPSGPPHR
jgi:hypothetical protein